MASKFFDEIKGQEVSMDFAGPILLSKRRKNQYFQTDTFNRITTYSRSKKSDLQAHNIFGNKVEILVKDEGIKLTKSVKYQLRSNVERQIA